MVETASLPSEYELLASSPMPGDRGEGWAYLRSFGEVFQTEDGTWFITHPEGVRFAERHPEIFSSERAFDTIGSPVPLIPGAMDPPDQRRYRAAMDPMLSPRVVNELEDELRSQVATMVDAFADRGECEIMQDLARLYPTKVFMTLFGLPLEDVEELTEWVNTILAYGLGNIEEQPPEAQEVATSLFNYLVAAVAEKRQNPDDGMLSKVLQLPEGKAWTEQELLGMAFFFVMAGLDTVKASIGFAFQHLASKPELRQRLIDDPSLIPNFIEELVRLESVAPLNPRITTEDVEVRGVTIPKGSYVLISVGAANRHPEMFETPDEFDLEQAGRGHVGFGGGIHRCAGLHLARRELRLIIEEFHKRIPEYELASGSQPRVDPWPRSTLVLDAVPLVFATKE